MLHWNILSQEKSSFLHCEVTMSKLRLLSWVLTLVFIVWVGTKGYYFFFDKTEPSFMVSGIEDGGFYGGDVSCSIAGEHPYKVSTVSIILDNKPLVHNFSISKASFEYPFTLNTKPLTNGKHALEIRLTDGTFHKRKVSKKYSIFIDNVPLQAAFIKQNSDGRVFQGKTLHIQFQTNKPLKEATVNLFSKRFPCFPESEGSLIYEGYIPVECEAKANEYLLSVDCLDYVDNEVTLEDKVQVVPFAFKRQKLTRIDAEQVEKDKEAFASQQLFNAKVAELLTHSPRQKLWDGSFYVPTEVMGISTDFGTIRSTQHKGLYAHKGVDILNAPKSIIWAPQSGNVIIKERYAYSGNTVVIDHGWGIFSMFFHLDDFADSLEVGQKIKRGNPLGTLGKTGYANGYHLHWEMRVSNVEVDPMQWVKEGF